MVGSVQGRGVDIDKMYNYKNHKARKSTTWVQNSFLLLVMVAVMVCKGKCVKEMVK